MKQRRKLRPEDIPDVRWSAGYTDLEVDKDGKVYLEGSKKESGQLVDGKITFWQG